MGYPYLFIQPSTLALGRWDRFVDSFVKSHWTGELVPVIVEAICLLLRMMIRRLRAGWAHP
jgi:hypothetical protein